MPRTTTKKPDPTPYNYQVIKDTREHEGKGWVFPVSDRCTGTTVSKLDTGDYSLVGHETEIVIERKGSPSEYAGNLSQDRFSRELDRLDSFKVPIIVLEFSLEQLLHWPTHCRRILKIPTRITAEYLMKRLAEVAINHPKIHTVYTGPFGKEYVSSVFKRFVEDSGRPQGL